MPEYSHTHTHTHTQTHTHAYTHTHTQSTHAPQWPAHVDTHEACTHMWLTPHLRCWHSQTCMRTHACICTDTHTTSTQNKEGLTSSCLILDCDLTSLGLRLRLVRAEHFVWASGTWNVFVDNLQWSLRIFSDSRQIYQQDLIASLVLMLLFI